MKIQHATTQGLFKNTTGAKNAAGAVINTTDTFTPSGKADENKVIDSKTAQKILLDRSNKTAPTDLLWIFTPKTGSKLLPIPGNDGRLYVADGNQVFALDGGTGQAKKAFTLPDDVTHFTVSKKGYVYAGDKTKVYGFYKRGKGARWEYQHKSWGKPLEDSPKRLAVDDNERVYVADQKDGVYKINGRSGKRKWMVWSPHIYDAPKVTPDGSVMFMKTANERLEAVDTKTGDGLWRFRTSFPTGEMVYSISPKGDVVYGYNNFYATGCKDGKTGKTKWGGPQINGLFGPPVFSKSGKHVYLADKRGTIMSLNAENGNTEWEKEIDIKEKNDVRLSWGRGGERIHITAAYDGSVIVGQENDTITALNGANGGKKWDFKVEGEEKLRPLAGKDGNIYIQGGSGKIYCLPVDLKTLTDNLAKKQKAEGKKDIPLKIRVRKNEVDIAGVKLPIRQMD